MNAPAHHARLLAAALAVAAGTALLSACGSDDEATVAQSAGPPSAADFPKPEGTIDDLLASVGQTDQLVASQSGFAFTRGQERFGFGLFDVGGEQITDARVAVYATHGADGQARGPFPARVEDLSTDPAFVAETTAPDDAKVVYVAEVPFDKLGEWRLAAVIDRPDGLVATRIASSVMVERHADIPAPGELAPRVNTPTADEVGGDLESIDTRRPPSSMHSDDLADVLGEKPVALLFATPALCLSRVCGPVVDIAEQVKAEYGDEVSFIHMEIYNDNRAAPDNLRPQVEAYGLPTEPWLFVIDSDGRVVERIEGAFSASELEDALQRVTG